ncbi:MAG: Rieske 2Fe-2S domain-containing protein [Planctomycetota bacterium]
MTQRFRWVQWNRHKAAYDRVLGLAVGVFLGVVVAVGFLRFAAPGDIAAPVLVMRALGLAGLVLLHAILMIGPLARLDDRFLVLLYNRRHMGVTFFFIVLLHALISIGYYGGFGEGLWITNVVSGGMHGSPGLPFELLGFMALTIFSVMAVSSHDFWLSFLGARTWKWLHMLVYAAYGLVVGHVLLGAVQDRVDPLLGWLVMAGVGSVSLLHIAAGLRQLVTDRRAETDTGRDEGWADALALDRVPMDRAAIVRLPTGQEAAVFRHAGGINAVSNVCAHQGGPLGEGEVVDGCITCPWHGYQYRAEDGCSPPPYTEKLPTYEVRIRAGRVELRVEANAPGTPVLPAHPESGEAD